MSTAQITLPLFRRLDRIVTGWHRLVDRVRDGYRPSATTCAARGRNGTPSTAPQALSSDLTASIRRRLFRPLGLRRLRPPRQIVGETRKRPLQRLAAVADRLAVRHPASARSARPQTVDEITTMPISESMPCQAIAARAPETSGRIAGDGGRPPEPFFEKMVGEVFQAGLHAPIIFAGDETKPSASRIFPASCSRTAGASPFGYSLYIRSSIGRPTALASISSTSSPRARKPRP